MVLALAAAEQRFANPPNENRLAELESLREFLKETLTLLDKRTQEMAAPAERLKALLMSKDKKAAILEMAGMSAYVFCMAEILGVCFDTSMRWSVEYGLQAGLVE